MRMKIYLLFINIISIAVKTNLILSITWNQNPHPHNISPKLFNFPKGLSPHFFLIHSHSEKIFVINKEFKYSWKLKSTNHY
jgi:hypothetical protein